LQVGGRKKKRGPAQCQNRRRKKKRKQGREGQPVILAERNSKGGKKPFCTRLLWGKRIPEKRPGSRSTAIKKKKELGPKEGRRRPKMAGEQRKQTCVPLLKEGERKKQFVEEKKGKSGPRRWPYNKKTTGKRKRYQLQRYSRRKGVHQLSLIGLKGTHPESKSRATTERKKRTRPRGGRIVCSKGPFRKELYSSGRRV